MRPSTAAHHPGARTQQPHTAVRLRVTARWMVTFLGFPLGGLASSLAVGPADTVGAAVTAGLVTGLILGGVQSWGLAFDRSRALSWTLSTGAGLAVGLAAGSSAVGFDTTVTALVAQGALTGLAVGVAQAVTLRGPIGRLAWGWPPALAVVWALGWAVTAGIGVDVDQHFTVFGSSGALLVTAATLILPIRLRQLGIRPEQENRP